MRCAGHSWKLGSRDGWSAGRSAGGECRAGGGRSLLRRPAGGCRRPGHQDRAARGRFRARLRRLCARPVELLRLAEPRQAVPHPRLQGQGRPRPAAPADRQGRRADPEPGAGRGRTRGLRLGRHAGRAQEADHGRHLGLRRSWPLQEPPRLRPAGPGRERPRLDHRHRARAGPGRHLRDRHRHRHVCPCRGAGGADRPRPDRRGPRHLGLALLLDGRVDDRAAARHGIFQLRMAAAGPHPSVHRALRRLSDLGRGAGADLDPERPRVRAAVPRRHRPTRPRERPGLRDRQGAQRAARRHQRHRGQELRRADLRRSLGPPRSRADRLGAGQQREGPDDPSAAPPHRLQLDRRRRRLDPRAGRLLHRRARAAGRRADARPAQRGDPAPS